MELSARYHHIDVGETYQGIFKFSISREFEQFITKLELYKLNANDQNIVNIVREHCQQNSTRTNILNKVESNLSDSVKLNYFEVENYYSEIRRGVDYFYQNNIDYNKIYNFNIAGKIKVPLNIWQFRRLYFDLKSFYENYFLLETIFKMIVNYDKFEDQSSKKSQKAVDNVNKYKQDEQDTELPQSQTNNLLDSSKISGTVESTKEITEQEQIFLDIFALSFNSLISTLLLHQFIIYYQYADDNCYVQYDDENQIYNVNIVRIFPNSYVFNKKYFKSIILSLSKYSLDDISFFASKVINNFKEERYNQEPKYIMMLSFLLFIYCLRYIYETHTQQFMSRFEEITSNPKVQEKIVNHFIKSYYSSNSIHITIHDVDVNYNSDQDKLIGEIADKYSYMINISQEDFVKNILGEYENQGNETSNDLDIPNCKEPEVFDLGQILSSVKEKERKENRLVSNYFIDRENTLDFEQVTEMKKDELLLNLFDYYELTVEGHHNNVISYPYKKLIEYINNPDTIFVNKEGVPNQILNYFETLKQILSQNYFRKENVKTVSYYKIVCDNLPDAKVVPHTLILYIIYQIVIPYYYDFYGITEFEDCLI